MFNYPTLRNSSLTDFRREMDRLFDDFWTTPALSVSNEVSSWSPSTDIEEEDDHYMLSLEVPGMKRDDLKIEVVDNQVLISGERKSEDKRQNKGGYYSERRFGKFQRAFALPTHVDAGKIEAQYQDGVLKVYVPKSEAAKPRQIKIGDSTGGIFSRLLGKKDEKPEKSTIEHKSGERVA
jgi:HSP20 family protein